MSDNNTIFLVAGGTGGHVFPALALAEELLTRGFDVICLTDKRGEKFFRNTNLVPYVIDSSAWAGDWKGKLKAGLKIVHGMIQSFELLREFSPVAVVGFGGYPSFPSVKAAQLLKIPTALHEQNAVYGRANRQLSDKANAIAISFKQTKLLPDSMKNKIIYTGNPIRSNFTTDIRPYQRLGQDAAINLLVFGGSQGSSLFSNVLPEAIERLPEELKKRLHIAQQTRLEDVDSVKSAYHKLGVSVQVQPFFSDMLKFYQKSHLIISRAGASTVTEVTALGRPAIFVPLASSLDGDQAQNATQILEQKAGWVIPEKEFTGETLAKKLQELLTNTEQLEQAAQAAATLGKPDAAARLANVITKIIK